MGSMELLWIILWIHNSPFPLPSPRFLAFAVDQISHCCYCYCWQLQMYRYKIDWHYRESIRCKALSNEMRFIRDSLRLLTPSRPRFAGDRFAAPFRLPRYFFIFPWASVAIRTLDRLNVRSTIANWRGLIRSVHFYD